MHVNPQIAALLEGLNHPSLPGIELSLGRMQALLALLGNPQEKLPPTVHVAGTNGKGSTIAFMRAMLEAQGKRVHVYTSPHLLRFNERIVLAGQEIADAALLDYLARVNRAVAEQPVTFFEATTAAAFLAFSEHAADILLLEVGMGGRLDATNLVTPIASVITPIGRDHEEYLGAGLARIAAEKAGIMKEGVPCLLGAQAPEALAVLETHAAATGTTLLRCGEEWSYRKHPFTVSVGPWECVLTDPALAGEHQYHNAALAAAVVHTIGVEVTTDAPRLAQWPARLQQLTQGPLVAQWGSPLWLDGAHNPHAAQALAQWAQQQPRPLAFVCGLMARKEASAFFALLAPLDAVLVTIPIPGHADAQAADILAAQAREAGCNAQSGPDASAALSLLARYRPATVVIAGSLYLAGEILKTHA